MFVVYRANTHLCHLVAVRSIQMCVCHLCVRSHSENRSHQRHQCHLPLQKKYVINLLFVLILEKLFLKTERNVKIIGVYDTAQIIFIEFSLD